MRTLRSTEWSKLYRQVWRPRVMHLPKEERARLVRACFGKAIYDSHEEARHLIETITLREDRYLGSYDCPLCGGIHTGNRKYLRWPVVRAVIEKAEGPDHAQTGQITIGVRESA